jgi:G3E family GTPase
VVINEFGEIGLDHELIESSSEDMVLLQSGCLCCTIRGDLVDTLRSLMAPRRISGGIAPFDRVLIETTGLADPAPILHTLMLDETLACSYRLDGVIATIDAATGDATLDRQEGSLEQAAVAGRLLLTKTDLVDDSAKTALISRLRTINRAAPLIVATNGAVEPTQVLDAGLAQGIGHAPGQRHPQHRRIQGPLVIHGGRHVFHLPIRMKTWPSNDRRSRIVVITRDMDEQALRDTLQIVTEDPLVVPTVA